MGRRGAIPFEERIGIDKFKELLKRLSIQDIAALYCEHEVEQSKKARCKACIRSIYRAKKRVEDNARAEKRYDPIEAFNDIPEIQSFIEYQTAKGRKDITSLVNQLREMWNWIKESELKELQRPALWDKRHLVVMLSKLKEKGIAQYGHKEALRRFFESQANHLMQKHPLIKASRKDLRSPKGARRKQTDFHPSMLPKIRECLNDEEQLAIDLHLTVKSREGDRGRGSLLNAQWKDINWNDNFYGFPTSTIDIYEPKTKGGTWWRHCPLDLWFADLSTRLKVEWVRQGGQKKAYILKFSYKEYLKLWKKISEHVGRKLEPHDCRRSAGGWLRDLGLSELALGQYNPRTGEAIGYTGVGWENSEIYFQRYGKMNPKAIYDKKIRLDTTIFTGLIHKILENK